MFQLFLCQKKIIKILLNNEIFQRSIYWKEYKTKEKDEDGNANAIKYINLDPSFQGVNRLFLIHIVKNMVIKLLEMDKENIFTKN